MISVNSGTKNILTTLGDDLLQQLFQLNREENRHDNRHNGRGVTAGGQQHGDTEECGVILGSKDGARKGGADGLGIAQLHNGRVAHRAADGDANELVAAHLLRRRHAKDDRQEVEEAGADSV